MKCRIERIFLFFPGLWLVTAMAAAIPPQANIEERPALKDKSLDNYQGPGSFRSTGRIVSGIIEAYGVPVCYEWSYISSADRSIILQPEHSFSISRGFSLATALNDLVTLSEGKLQWQRIRGSICVLSTGVGGETVNCLDTLVSLDLKNVSTWEAFRALATAVNSVPDTKRRLVVTPMPLAIGSRGPSAFTEDWSVSVKVKNVTAREAACAIIAASPLHMGYTYNNRFSAMYPGIDIFGEIHVYFFVDGERFNTHEGMDGERTWWWNQQIREMIEGK